MVERSLSMREVPGSIPGASKIIFILSLLMQILSFGNIVHTYFIYQGMQQKYITQTQIHLNLSKKNQSYFFILGLKGVIMQILSKKVLRIYAVTRIRTWVTSATTKGTNHYTITASYPIDSIQYNTESYSNKLKPEVDFLPIPLHNLYICELNTGQGVSVA